MSTTKLSSEPDNSTSWFVNLRHLCTLYGLPSSLSLLASPPSKGCFKNLLKCQVIDHWKKHYEDEAAEKVSLKYFKPQYLSLTRPHPLWTTCTNNPWETNKALVVSLLLSGRYVTDHHSRQWTKDNQEGFCLLCPGSEEVAILTYFEELLIRNRSMSLIPSRPPQTFYWSNLAQLKPDLSI